MGARMSDIAERLKAHAYCLAIVNPDVENKSAILMREAADFISEEQTRARRFAAELRDRHIRIKIDRHGDVYGQLCDACSAEDAQPHAVGCIVGEACALIRETTK